MDTTKKPEGNQKRNPEGRNVTLRLPGEVGDMLDELCKDEVRSANNMMEQLIRRAHAAKQKGEAV